MSTKPFLIGLQSPELWPSEIRDDIDQIIAALQSSFQRLSSSGLFDTVPTLTLSSFTNGSVLFVGTAGLVSQDNTNFFWDNPNNYLGIGTASPAVRVHIVGADDTTLLRMEAADGFKLNLVPSQSDVARISAAKDGANGTTLAFTTQTTGGTTTEAARIDSSQRLGVNITPAGNGPLQVKAGTQTTNIAKVGGTLFDHYVDVQPAATGSDQTLYSDTVKGNTIAVAGDKLTFEYWGSWRASTPATSTVDLKVTFGGVTVFDSGGLAVSTTSLWVIRGTILNASGAIRGSVSLLNNTVVVNQVYVTDTKDAAITFSNDNALVLVGNASGVGSATTDITAEGGFVEWKSAA